MEALVAGGLFFVAARGYTVVSGVDASVSAQVVVSSVLVASAYAAGLGQDEPAVKALTAGALFAGSMYALGNDRVATHAVLGTVATYGAGLLTVREENGGEDTNGD